VAIGWRFRRGVDHYDFLSRINRRAPST
jgi:hypothetical protein